MSVQPDLWQAVDRLTNPYRQRLERDNGTHEWVSMSSLFDQLSDAVQTGAGTQAHGVQGSKPPLDTACLSLLIEIAEAVADACRSLTVRRSFDTPTDLRAVVSEMGRRTDDGDEQDWWVGQLNSWCGQIRAAISSDPDRPWQLHNVACPDCAARTVPVADAGETVRRSAVLVTWSRGYVRAVECRACGAVWYRGADLDRLVEQMMGRRDTPDSLTA